MPEATTTLIPYLTCKNAEEALEFWKKAFGAEIGAVSRMPHGPILNAQFTIDGVLFYVNDEMPEHGAVGPQTLGGNPTTFYFRVADCDAYFHRAVEAGCQVRMPLEDMFWGDRYCLVADPYGYLWTFATKIRDVSEEEIQKALTSSDGPGCQ